MGPLILNFVTGWYECWASGSRPLTPVNRSVCVRCIGTVLCTEPVCSCGNMRKTSPLLREANCGFSAVRPLPYPPSWPQYPNCR